MKNIFAILAFLFISISVSAQEKHGKHTIKWPELDAYHDIISQTFHPSEEGNLEPLKSKSAELMVRAQRLAKSTPPADYNRPELKKAIQELLMESKKMDDAVKGNKPDDELTAQIAKVHDAFHKIAGLCSKD